MIAALTFPVLFTQLQVSRKTSPFSFYGLSERKREREREREGGRDSEREREVHEKVGKLLKRDPPLSSGFLLLFSLFSFFGLPCP